MNPKITVQLMDAATQKYLPYATIVLPQQLTQEEIQRRFLSINKKFPRANGWLLTLKGE